MRKRVDEIELSDKKYEDRLSSIEKTLQELSDKMLALQLRLVESGKEWPTPAENRAEKQASEQAKHKVSFAEKCRSRRKGSVILLGDSLVRGVGQCLEKDNELFTPMPFGGAKIEDIGDELATMDEKQDSSVVLMVGTNNLKQDGTEDIMKKYEKMIDEAKKSKFSRISVVGILRRDDLSQYLNSKRLGLNIRLKELCVRKKVEYLEKELAAEHLSRDKLHLSRLGQDEVARFIFGSCRKHLNL